ncbi:hypothetical protein AB0L82_43125 [Nocardia sp. NPDC052001]|uniref:hypothetical protein n=1 Tax=Nocardia sp. NPDC052001 TaxID=3154853 RepID=UPI003423D00D
MIREKAIFEVECDRCQSPLGYADDGCAWHFDTHQAALEELTECGWVQAANRLLCSDCVAKEACALLGHTWGDWEPVERFAYSGLRRGCELCGAGELDPPPPPLVFVDLSNPPSDTRDWRWFDDEQEA